MMENVGRVRWKCRRGMLELDLILLKFFDKHYSNLSPDEKKQFELLLEEPDPVLQEYLYGLAQSEDVDAQALVKKIRNSN